MERTIAIARTAEPISKPSEASLHRSWVMKPEMSVGVSERRIPHSRALPASQSAHHHPITRQVLRLRQATPWLPFHSSRTVSNGLTRFASGTNHHPTAHPGVNFRPPLASSIAFRCARYCQTHHTMPVPTNTRSQTHTDAITRTSARSASARVIEPPACTRPRRRIR
jgi:hypothetical protein